MDQIGYGGSMVTRFANMSNWSGYFDVGLPQLSQMVLDNHRGPYSEKVKTMNMITLLSELTRNQKSLQSIYVIHSRLCIICLLNAV